MPFAITDAPSTDGYVDVRLRGTLTREEFDEAAAAVLAVLHDWSRVLFDAAGLENSSEVFTLYLRSPWREQMPGNLRQAAVIAPTAASVARSWVRLSGPGSAGTQAFAARGPAVDWLLGEYQTTTGGS